MEKIGITWGELKNKVFPIWVKADHQTEVYEVYIPAEFGGGSYDIPFDQIKSEKALLVWIRHLSEKCWCKAETINSLIAEVYEVWEENFYAA